GLPILPILYLFYNTNLIKVYKIEKTKVVRYINNVLILAIGLIAQRNCKTLKGIY
ncbi:hypothetical protein K432DRAFT_311245, partial [Lepidopterella palustris CBS 459.81]